MSLLVIGTVAFDTIETPFGIADRVVGGSGTFLSISASYFAQNIRLVGIVGYDFPQKELEYLQSRGIDISGVEILKDEKSFYWHGKYHFDLNTRETLATELNALLKFDPVIKDDFKDSKYICLGNIDPVIQQKVIKQINKPKLIMCDTMNFWIESKPDEVVKTLGMIDIVIVNDTEARELTNDFNLVTCAKKIMAMGPKVVVIKKGEHGALLFYEDTIFSAPAYPLEMVFDPTGAGDTFAGGFMGWLSKTDNLSPDNLKLAVIYGSAMASLAVEKFSIEGIRNLSQQEIMKRFSEFKSLTHFENMETV